MAQFALRALAASSVSLASLAGAWLPASAQEPSTAEEIIVTATGRAEGLQNVPIAVTAVSGESFRASGGNDLRDLSQLAASFSMATGQSNAMGAAARIRGIATAADNPGFEAAVGVFIDGIYRARPGAALSDLPELERIEVLRGPQGTLFGRNTSAGAISIITAQPDFTPGAGLEAGFGLDGLGQAGARAMLNTPLSDALALRFDGSVRAREGIITDRISGRQVNDRDRWSARGQALWRMSPTGSLRIILDGAGSDESCCAAVPIAYGFTQNAITALLGPAGTPAINPRARVMTLTPASSGLPALGPGLPAQPAAEARGYSEKTDDRGVSAHVERSIGAVQFTSISAYRDWSATRNQDPDFNLIDIAYRQGLEVGIRNFTQEMRLQGQAGPVHWLIGGFYADETLDTTDRVRMGAHANLYANALTMGATAPLAAIGGPAMGCELYDSSAAGEPDSIPSFFYCVSDNPATPLVFDPNPALAGLYLVGHTAGEGQQADYWRLSTRSFSIFTHNEIALRPDLTLTIGARLSTETKDLSARLFSVSTSCATLQAVEIATTGLFPAPGGLVSLLQTNPATAPFTTIACNPLVNPIANGDWADSDEETAWSGKLSLAYQISPDHMVYVGYAHGYKAGGFNVDRSGFAITPALVDPSQVSTRQLYFAPEYTDNFEIGLRSRLFDAATLNITAFHQKISDYQLNAFNGFNFITRNIPDAVSQGVEIELAARLADALTLAAGLTYNDAFYDSTVVFNPLNPGPNTVRAGDRFAFAPEWVATGAISYEQPLGGTLMARFHFDGRWDSPYRTQTLNRDPRSDNKSYAIFNGRIGLGPSDHSWSFEVWGRNLTDEFYYVGAINPPLQDALVAYPNDPRTYGVSLRARY